MTRQVPTVSLRTLHAAVKSAVEAAKKQRPEIKIDPIGFEHHIPIIYYPWWFIGIPAPWPLINPEVVAFSEAFAANLAANPQIGALAKEGAVTPIVMLSGKQIQIGFAPAGPALTE